MTWRGHFASLFAVIGVITGGFYWGWSEHVSRPHVGSATTEQVTDLKESLVKITESQESNRDLLEQIARKIGLD